MSTLLSIPLEIRLIIYACFLEDHKYSIVHNTQPSNAHITLLHTCKQVEHEAGLLAGYRAYLSLRYEREIIAFLDNADAHVASQVSHLDVANDGRLVQHPKTEDRIPVSRLHRVLDKLTSLISLRVFDCHRVRALHEFVSGARFVWSFENAMFPQKRHGISSYEYYIAPETKAVALHSVSTESIRRLRLTGFLRLDEPLANCKMLQHLTIHGVTGNYFDQRPLMGMEGIALQSFQYHQGDRLGFEIRAPFLLSLTSGSHSSLRKLVLLQCRKLSTIGLASCIQSLTVLEYFAVSIITVNELDGDFIAALPPSTRTIKIKITPAPWSRPLITEELILCNSLKKMFTSPARPNSVHLYLPDVVHQQPERHEWASIVSETGVDLRFGDWETSEAI